MIGILVSNLPGVEYGQLHYHSLEIDNIQAFKSKQGNYNAKMTLSSQETQDLMWWVANMAKAYKPMSRPNPSKVIQSDASKWDRVLFVALKSQVVGGHLVNVRHI